MYLKLYNILPIATLRRVQSYKGWILEDSDSTRAIVHCAGFLHYILLPMQSISRLLTSSCPLFFLHLYRFLPHHRRSLHLQPHRTNLQRRRYLSQYLCQSPSNSNSRFFGKESDTECTIKKCKCRVNELCMWSFLGGELRSAMDWILRRAIIEKKILRTTKRHLYIMHRQSS